MGKNQFNLAQRIQKRERRCKVEGMLLRGITNKSQMAAALHVTFPTIAKDVEYVIEKMWVPEDIKRSARKRNLRIRQLEFIANKAILEYERSQAEAVEVVVTHTPHVCRTCKGSCFVDGVECENCGGRGKTVSSTITRRAKEQTGDATYLRCFKECVTEIAKIEGLYPKGESTGAQVTIHQGTLNVDLTSAPPEELLRAKGAFAKLEDAMRKQIVVEDAKIENAIIVEEENKNIDEKKDKEDV